MKNELGALLLAVLVIAGGLVVYNEASLIPLACDAVEFHCLSLCQGTFLYMDCWDYQGGRFCDFKCYDHIGYTWPCWWDDPMYGICKLY